MKFIFKDSSANAELVLPITPESFEDICGIKVETVNIHTVGDVALAGYSILPTLKISCVFPAKAYPFNQPSAVTDPYYYVEKFKAWSESRTVLRLVISETSVNRAVLIEDFTYGEKDGSGDVYATITLHGYRQLETVKTQGESTGNKVRPAEDPAPVTAETYTVKSGDTLSAIARKFYGNAALYPKLAVANGIKNANIIRVGQIIKLPDKSLL